MNYSTRKLLLIAAGSLALGCPSEDGPSGGDDSGVGIGDVGETGGTGGTGGTGSSQPDGTADSATAGGDGATTAGDDGGTDATSTTGEPGKDADTSTPEPELLFLAVDPPDTIVELDLGQMDSLAFTVTGVFDDGSEADLTDQVESWTVTNPMVGSMTGAQLDMGAFADAYFAATVVTATVDGEEGNAQVTVAAYDQSSESPDFFFVLPYEDPGGSQENPLTFSTDVKSLDVFFNVDTTGSMIGSIQNLQNSLVSTIIPTIEAELNDTWFGAGAFEDFPVDPFGWGFECTGFGGSAPDQPFELLQQMTNSAANVQTAVNNLSNGGTPIGCGRDLPESNIEALYQIATGDGLLAGPGLTFVASNAAGIGGVAFRDGTMPVIISISDAVSQDDAAICLGSSYSGNASVSAVAHTRDEMYDALDDICARVVPVAVNDFDACGPLNDGVEFATESGAVIPPEAWDELVGGRPPGCAVGQCCTGLNGTGVATQADGLCPLVYRVTGAGTGLDDTVVDGVQMLTRYAPFTVSTEVDGVAQDQDGVATPPGTTTADFIVSVTPFSHGPVPVGGVPDPTLTATTFEGVVPDTDVTFTIEAFNDFVPQGPDPRLFVATIRVLADGCSELDERDVFILVPPAELPDPG